MRPPSLMVPTTQVIRLSTPACAQIRWAIFALVGESSTENTLACGADLRIRSAL